jgi:ABC-type nickel/cobalt efflux system permease component RcnA
VAGLASIVTLPLAIYATRFSDEYELLHAGFAIPVGVGLGVLALALARRAHRQASLSLSGTGSSTARIGRVLGVVGLCIAAAAVVSLLVYGLLEYVGSRE